MLDTDQALYLRVIPLLEGSLCTQLEEGNTQLAQIKDVSVNLVALPIQT